MEPVTILMPVYNAARYLPTAVDSILAQTYPHWTLLCIDDGSTDDSSSLLSEYTHREKRIKVLWRAHNGGLSSSLNFGLRHVKTEWVARMDADDWSHPQRLERQLAFVSQYPTMALVGTWGFTFTNSPLFSRQPLTLPISETAIREHLQTRNPFIHSSMLCRKSVLDQVHGYDESYRYCPDFALWRKIAFTLPSWGLYNVPEQLVGYRVQHQDSLTARYPLRKWWENLRVVCS